MTFEPVTHFLRSEETDLEIIETMRRILLILFLAAGAFAANAQTAAKPSMHCGFLGLSHNCIPKLPPGIPNLPPGVPAVQAPIATAFSLRYQDITIGGGADAEPEKVYKVHYTGWLGANGRADDGRKFDSSYDHPGPPIMGKDGRPERDADGKVKLSDPQPITFIQGMGHAIPGFDQGFAGMKVGGKRRIFIPWQLAYGEQGRQGPDAAHPGIPPKSDLIFDVELKEVSDMPMPPNHPPMSGVHAPPSGSTRQPTPATPPASPTQPK
jgi:peptidylprolyl isomerase